jgi:hypothetical protein
MPELYDLDGKTFIDLCLDGFASLREFYFYADKWQDTDKSIPVYTFLGLKKEEWNDFCGNPLTPLDVLVDILQDRLYQRYISSQVDKTRNSAQFTVDKVTNQTKR